MKTYTIPKEAVCDCRHQIKITTVYPLPDICKYCRKAILKEEDKEL